MTDELRVYFSYRSPYSRLGLHKIASLKQKTDIEIKLFPLIALAEGVPFFDPATSPPKMAYYAEDAYRMTKRMGLTMRMPNPFEMDFEPSNLLFMAAKELGKELEWAITVSDLRWGKGKDISKIDVLEVAAAQLGLGTEFVHKGLANPLHKESLEVAKKASGADMVFGVPFAVLDKKGKQQKFWGQDRFDLLTEILSV